MAKYRKKPIVIEAEQFLGNTTDMVSWARSKGAEVDEVYHDLVGNLYCRTLEGDLKVTEGDYVICGVQGEFYPCKPDIFNATYEVVDEVVD